MSLALYASESDLDGILSPFGVEVRKDDDPDNLIAPATNAANEAANITSVLQQATVKVNQKLVTRYTIAVLQASTWVRFCTAYLAARALCLRRGNPVPEAILNECEEYDKELAGIFQGIASLVCDTGLAPPRFDPSPTVTNYSVDSRYARGKVRRIPTTSTGGSQSGDRKQQNMREFVWWN